MTVGLAIHTASPDLGLALIDTQTNTRHQIWPLGRALSSQIHNNLMQFIQPYGWDSLDWLAVCIGPGGFTGTRMGVVVARTLAQQLDIPLFGISSLVAISVQSAPPLGQSPSDIAVTMPAKRGAVYGAIYRPDDLGDLNPLVEPIVLPAEQWQSKLNQWDRPLKAINVPAGEGLGPSVTGLLTLAQRRWQQGHRPHWSEVIPFYGQHPV